MNDKKVIYKIVAEIEWKTLETFTSDDPTKALLIPELLEENIKKLQDYYLNLKFREIITIRDEQHEVQIRDYIYKNETLDKLVKTYHYNDGYYYYHLKKIPLPQYKTIAHQKEVKYHPGYYTDDYDYRLSRWKEFNEINERKREASLIYGIRKQTSLWPVGNRPNPNPIWHPEKLETTYEYERVLLGMREYQDYLCVKDFGFHEGLAISQIKYCPSSQPYYGFIDEKKNIVIDYKYDTAGPFSEGLARVGINKKFGFVNKKGELVIPCIYDYADDFHDGFAKVAIYKSGFGSEYKVGCIDKKGRLVIKCVYDNLSIRERDILQYRLNGDGKILEEQKRMEMYTNQNINMLDYIQYCNKLKKGIDECCLNRKNLEWRITLMQDAIRDRFGSGYIKLYDFVNSKIYEVRCIEKQLKIVQEDGTVLCLDYDTQEIKQSNKKLTKKKSLTD